MLIKALYDHREICKKNKEENEHPTTNCRTCLIGKHHKHRKDIIKSRLMN